LLTPGSRCDNAAEDGSAPGGWQAADAYRGSGAATAGEGTGAAAISAPGG
jgi:hypothetical protein